MEVYITTTSYGEIEITPATVRTTELLYIVENKNKSLFGTWGYVGVRYKKDSHDVHLTLESALNHCAEYLKTYIDAQKKRLHEAEGQLDDIINMRKAV